MEICAGFHWDLHWNFVLEKNVLLERSEARELIFDGSNEIVLKEFIWGSRVYVLCRDMAMFECYWKFIPTEGNQHGNISAGPFSLSSSNMDEEGIEVEEEGIIHLERERDVDVEEIRVFV